MASVTQTLGSLESVTKTDSHYSLQYETGEQARIEILNSHVFRYYMSPNGDFLPYPKPNNPSDKALIVFKKDYSNEYFENSTLKDDKDYYVIDVDKIQLHLQKINGTLTVYDKRTNKEVFNESEPLSYEDFKTTQIIKQRQDEYFFGGGMQNGRFTHKGEIIEIVNTNEWTDGGVASPCPFYWSSYGYGVLRHTWKPGFYDFGSQTRDTLKTIHYEGHFDGYFFINSQPKDILNDYYELTGQPVAMPEYSFYQSHLNAFNRDYWVKVDADTPRAILFEDGHYYRCYQPKDMGDKEGILESLNGENNNYQFSARAMIDRYERHDMPLGWFVPNDGYGSGYGQTDTLEGDINNLKEFADYARAKGVEAALWTESNLEPVDPENPVKGDRDLGKEVAMAGVVALKCDVAWIGEGYSFALSSVENATKIFVSQTKNRPFIIMVDGWGGTQRYSGIWSGDQSGGHWEYIRFHIPTYVGTGLSGMPVIGSDMDGIYHGGSKEVNVRDYQWKTFTPLQLNMDGWGNIAKTPFTFDDEATAINRAYLKMKSIQLPYNYTIGHECIHGLPMIRAMFLEFPEEPLAYTKDSQYQFMWGPSILVAPIYNDDSIDGESIRNGIYLPDKNQLWIDLFTGEKYQGGKVYNNIKCPLWKIPVFVKDGAIIPLTNPNNNPKEVKRDNRIFNLYPNGETYFEVYEDDGKSVDYLEGKFATTKVTTIGPKSNDKGDLLISVNRTKGSYTGLVKERTTVFQVMASKNVQRIKAAINGKSIEISQAKTEKDYNLRDNVYFFKEDFTVNEYLREIAGVTAIQQKCLLIKIQNVDVTANEIHIKVKDYINKNKIFGNNSGVNPFIKFPSEFIEVEEYTTSSSLKLQWSPVEGIDYYEIERDGAIFTNIIGTEFTFDGFKFETKHSFRIRSAASDDVSEWSDYVAATTKADPLNNTIKGVAVTSSVPCQANQEVCKLTDANDRTMWHTDWQEPWQANPDTGKYIKLSFDLGDIYEIDKMEYIPRSDAGNGTILELQYETSIDGEDWSSKSEQISWEADATEKIVNMNGAKFRYMKMYALSTVGGFGSGRHMRFYKKVM